MIDKNGKRFGWFFTKKNIFENKIFQEWFKSIPEVNKKIVLEPFAGKNTIIDMLQSLNNIEHNQFMSFDIFPRREDVILNDTLKKFPVGYDIVVTNPPFIARNSASRREFDLMEYFDLCEHEYNDLYEVCLDKILRNTKYAAVIVPESFLKSKYFKNRLHSVISLAQKKIFEQTEHPVCLALFQEKENNGIYNIYHNEILIGNNQDLQRTHHEFYEYQDKYQITEYGIMKFDDRIGFKMFLNSTDGQIGLIAIDATDAHKKIRFCSGSEILESDVGHHSRLRTRFKIEKLNGDFSENEIKEIIDILNHNLKSLREKTHDIFLTSFKGMNNSMMYRRRLDFITAKKLMIMSVNHWFDKK